MKAVWFGEWPALDKWVRKYGKDVRREELLNRADAIGRKIAETPGFLSPIEAMCAMELAAEELLDEDKRQASDRLLADLERQAA